nr:fibronectin type III domain-containing protein [uncultured Allomuricauda sp.]
MTGRYNLIGILIFLITSCSSDNENVSPETIIPVISKITTTDITGSSAVLTWEASISDGTNMSFDVFLGNTKVAEDITSSSSFTLRNLTELTNYSGKILASSKTGQTSEKAFSFSTNENPSPSAFEVSVSDITLDSARVSWTSSTIGDSTEKITYEVYLNDNLIRESFIGTAHILKELATFEEYLVKIVATSAAGKATSAEKTFTTKGSPPSSFPLTVGNWIDGREDLDPMGLQVLWTPPTVEDGSDYHYKIYLDDFLEADFRSDTSDSFIFNDLNEGQTYTVKVVADALNGTETAESITFTTITYPELTDFEVGYDSLESTSVRIFWTPSTYPGGGTVTYRVNLNGEQHHEPNTYIGGTPYSLDELEPNTEYMATVIAVHRAHPEKTLSKEISFTTDYAEHPSLQVLEAVLYTPQSQFFGGQLIVSFSENIDGINIIEFSAGNIMIGNYITNPSSISSGVFSANDYDVINSDKTGYVLVMDNGATYKLSFQIVEETN